MSHTAFRFGQPKRATLTHLEKGCLVMLTGNTSCRLLLRPVGGLGSAGNYCLYMPDRSPLCAWARGVIEGLIVKNYISLDKETGEFKIL